MANNRQPSFDKQVLKSLVSKAHSQSEAVKVLKGESGGTLKLLITSKPVHKWFLDGEPITKQEFDRLSFLPRHWKQKIQIYIGNKLMKC